MEKREGKSKKEKEKGVDLDLEGEFKKLSCPKFIPLKPSFLK